MLRKVIDKKIVVKCNNKTEKELFLKTCDSMGIKPYVFTRCISLLDYSIENFQIRDGLLCSVGDDKARFNGYSIVNYSDLRGIK